MLNQLIEVYRVKNWAKILGISVIGLLLGVGTAATIFFIVGIIQSILLLSFLFVTDDINDFLVEKRKKYIGSLIVKKKINLRTALLFLLVPLIVSLFIAVAFFSEIYFSLYLLFLFFALTYSLPKVRMGDKPFVDAIYDVILFSLIFLQSLFFANSEFTVASLFFLVWFALYTFALELIHQLDHYKIDIASTAKHLGIGKSIAFVRATFFASVLTALVFVYRFPSTGLLALVMLSFAFFRLVYSRKFSTKTNFGKIRNLLGGWIEGFIYILLILLRLY